MGRQPRSTLNFKLRAFVKVWRSDRLGLRFIGTGPGVVDGSIVISSIVEWRSQGGRSITFDVQTHLSYGDSRQACRPSPFGSRCHVHWK